MQKNYHWKYKTEVEENKIASFSKSLNISRPLAKMLIQRNIDTFDKAKDFFRPKIEELHNPFLMKDMDIAVERLSDAIENGEKILVYGDYDVDGTTSVALVYSFLNQIYEKVDFYIPDRHKEGYGISMQAIDFAASNDFSLIISLDCGIKAIKQIDYANEKNIDFIICDHHRPGEKLPNAVAVLDAKREDCHYPYDELSGCGVGFKLMQAYTIEKGLDEKELFQYLDYLVISIAADIVPITGENRILAYYGMKIINSKPRAGVAKLIELAGLEKDINTTNVVFGFAPRINAAGRMGDAKNAVRLLISKDTNDAFDVGQGVNQDNTDRKELDRAITEEVIEKISNSEELKQAKTTVLYNENWHKGVLGIVASRSIETFYRPTIILTKSNGLLTGSARSVEGFDVYNAIDACIEHLEQFGGHKYAAGLALKEENFEAFCSAFEKQVASTITADQLIPKIEVDTEMALSNVTDSFFNIIKQMEPFGPENMQPVFTSKGVVDSGYSRVVGEKHLKLSVRQGNSPVIDGIAFGMGEVYEKISGGQPFDICYSIEQNEWNGRVNLQLKIRDIKWEE